MRKKIWTMQGPKHNDFSLGEEHQTLMDGSELVRVAKRRIGVPFDWTESKDPQIVPVGMSDREWLLKTQAQWKWCAGAAFYDQMIVEIEMDGVRTLLYEAAPEHQKRIFFGRRISALEAYRAGLQVGHYIVDGTSCRSYSRSIGACDDPEGLDQFIERIPV